jgi:hypothetical protein
MSEQPNCEMCGDPMPPGEEMFKFHGYSGPCPKPIKPLSSKHDELKSELARELKAHCGTIDRAERAEQQRDKLLSALNQVLTILRDLDCPLDVRVNMAHDVAHENVAAVVKADISIGLHRWIQSDNTGGNNPPCKAEGK